MLLNNLVNVQSEVLCNDCINIPFICAFSNAAAECGGQGPVWQLFLLSTLGNKARFHSRAELFQVHFFYIQTRVPFILWLLCCLGKWLGMRAHLQQVKECQRRKYTTDQEPTIVHGKGSSIPSSQIVVNKNSVHLSCQADADGRLIFLQRCISVSVTQCLCIQMHCAQGVQERELGYKQQRKRLVR